MLEIGLPCYSLKIIESYLKWWEKNIKRFKNFTFFTYNIYTLLMWYKKDAICIMKEKKYHILISVKWKMDRNVLTIIIRIGRTPLVIILCKSSTNFHDYDSLYGWWDLLTESSTAVQRHFRNNLPYEIVNWSFPCSIRGAIATLYLTWLELSAAFYQKLSPDMWAFESSWDLGAFGIELTKKFSKTKFRRLAFH